MNFLHFFSLHSKPIVFICHCEHRLRCVAISYCLIISFRLILSIYDIRHTKYYLHIFSITFKNPSFFEKYFNIFNIPLARRPFSKLLFRCRQLFHLVIHYHKLSQHRHQPLHLPQQYSPFQYLQYLLK